jgi:periplasmic protein TonB
VSPRAINLAIVLALHAAVIAAILSHAPTRRAIAQAAPVFVRFIETEAPRLSAPPAQPRRIEPDKPMPVERPRVVPKPAATPPVITAAPSPEAPRTIEARPAPAKPEPAPAAAAASAAPLPPGPAATSNAASAAVAPPSFNADYLSNPAPPYPALSRRMGEEGRVVVRVLVSTEGHAERIELRTSSGHPRLDDVALDTVRKWKFVPAKQGDQPVAAWVLVPISFSLKG